MKKSDLTPIKDIIYLGTCFGQCSTVLQLIPTDHASHLESVECTLWSMKSQNSSIYFYLLSFFSQTVSFMELPTCLTMQIFLYHDAPSRNSHYLFYFILTSIFSFVYPICIMSQSLQLTFFSIIWKNFIGFSREDTISLDMDISFFIMFCISYKLHNLIW